MWESNPYLISILAILGLCIGSFLNVVIYRVPKRLQASWEKESRDFLGITQEEAAETPTISIAFPPSHCTKCGAAIRPWHNIPVLSYLFLRGTCASCAAPISIQYPLVEIACGAIFVLVFLTFSDPKTALFALFFCLLLVVLTGIDFKTQLLPDNLTLPLLWLGLIANSQGLFTDLPSAVYGAVFGYLSLWSVYWAFKLLTGKEGMGYGDFKLLAALGAWVGWQQLPLIILLSSLIGAIIGILLIATSSKEKQTPIAFGPYLALAGITALFRGDEIISAYLGYLA